MKVWLRCVVLLGVTSACATSPAPDVLAASPDRESIVRTRPEAPAPGQIAPDFKLYDSIGDLVDFGSLRGAGPVAVILVEGSWCASCRTLLARVQRRLSAFRETGASVVAVTADDAQRAARMVQSLGLGFPLLLDPERKVARAFGVATKRGFSQPAVVVVNDAGMVVWSQMGDALSEDLILSELRALETPDPATAPADEETSALPEEEDI